MVEKADAEVNQADYTERWAAVARALRQWAIAHSHEWALIYGSPVPGYAAPQDTIPAASRLGVVLLTILSEAGSASTSKPAKSLNKPKMTKAISASIASIRALTDGAIPDTVLVDALGAWSQLIGLINMELFGHFVNVVDDPDQFYGESVRRLGVSLNLP